MLVKCLHVVLCSDIHSLIGANCPGTSGTVPNFELLSFVRTEEVIVLDFVPCCLANTE